MMKQSYTLLILSICCYSAILLGACAKGTSYMVSPDQSIFELSPVQYNHTQLLEIVDDSDTMEHLLIRYTPSCLRKIDDGAYRLSYLGIDEVASVYFDKSGEKTFGWIYDVSTESHKLTEFKIGDPLEQVMSVDPAGRYSFLYTGRDDISKVSEHYCQDGYLVVIEYSETALGAYVISSIHKEWIQLISMQ